MTEERVPISVAVLGSCITRDNFNSRLNPEYRRFYHCPVHSNQASIISLMSPPVDVDWSPTRQMSDYDRWNVGNELTRGFLDEVRKEQPDYLVLDFFGDVHFGCVRLEDGRYVTDNRWKIHHTDWYQREREAGRLTPVKYADDPDAYFAIWCEAFDRFAAFCREELPDTRLVIHRGHNTNLLRMPDRPFPVALNEHGKVAPLDVEASNATWRRLDDYAISSSGAEVIDLLDREYPTFAEHPWGAFYVHYALDYYHRFLAELHKIHLQRAFPGLVADMVADIDAVQAEQEMLTREQHEAVVRDHQARLDGQRGRLRTLERRSLRARLGRLVRR